MTDRLIVRYAALAHRLEALLEEPLLQFPLPQFSADTDRVDAAASPPLDALPPAADTAVASQAPVHEEIAELLADTVYRLGLYASAMPGARPCASQGLLDALERELARIHWH